MELRWSEEAANDLERITDYLFENTPHHAPELVRAIYDAPVILLTFPRRGRPGKREGTRELVLSSLPYIVVYRIQDEVIQLVRILHGAHTGLEGWRRVPSPGFSGRSITRDIF